MMFQVHVKMFEVQKKSITLCEEMKYFRFMKKVKCSSFTKKDLLASKEIQIKMYQLQKKNILDSRDNVPGYTEKNIRSILLDGTKILEYCPK